METTQLGRSGLTISRLCLGTVNFDYTKEYTPESDFHRLMDSALDLCINFFDTAKDYGDSCSKS